MIQDNTIGAFFALLKAGLWETAVNLSEYGQIDYKRVYELALEQCVTGLIAAGLSHVQDVKPPKQVMLQFVAQTLQIEKRNIAMNAFVGETVEQLRKKDVYAILVKGQGIAQCYERPLWRPAGDIDFLLNGDNYEKAKAILLQNSISSKSEGKYSMHLGMVISSWLVELQGSLRTGLSAQVDATIDKAQHTVFYDGDVRSWQNGKTQVFLPGENTDAFFVFTHFLKHFYKEEGVNLRQMCDWCRLLWRYKDTINDDLIEEYLKCAGLVSEWKAFSAIAVNYLGMQREYMPLFGNDNKWNRKGDKIVNLVLKGGNIGRWKALSSIVKIFPYSTLRFLPGILFEVNWLKMKERFFKTKR